MSSGTGALIAGLLIGLILLVAGLGVWIGRLRDEVEEARLGWLICRMLAREDEDGREGEG